MTHGMEGLSRARSELITETGEMSQPEEAQTARLKHEQAELTQQLIQTNGELAEIALKAAELDEMSREDRAAAELLANGAKKISHTSSLPLAASGQTVTVTSPVPAVKEKTSPHEHRVNLYPTLDRSDLLDGKKPDNVVLPGDKEDMEKFLERTRADRKAMVASITTINDVVDERTEKISEMNERTLLAQRAERKKEDRNSLRLRNVVLVSGGLLLTVTIVATAIIVTSSII